MPPQHKVRDKRKFLLAVLRQLAGAAFVSIEGDLSGTSLVRVSGASGDESELLKRNTLWPKQDFILLPLEVETVEQIVAAVGGTVPSGILHIQIQKDGRLEFGSYDNFSPNGMFLGPALTPSFINRLRTDGVLSPWSERDSAKSGSL
jgi:hypothetical protein